ncbi:MAG: beta-N-acetylhexosaminidase [Clostridia bacterium]|nr:beta-N-acetylhexosaminidase [Clostridia bacterium]
MKIQFLNLPEELKAPLNEIAPLLSYEIGEGGIPVAVRKNETGPKIIGENGAVTVEYHKMPEFFRLLTLLPARMEGIYEETPAFGDLCLMSDCSRNAVYNIPSAKRMIRYLALMGFTSFMLYTEDTYEVPEYPFFGYMRGRFTQEELQELDGYAASFGIELIPCMQVLAHLEGSLRWPCFKEITDVGNILLVGEEKTYAFIEAMIRACRACFKTDRIHIGMDEAHLLGAGQYLDRNGYRDRSEIILEHLNRVVKICEKYDFKPMMWSDMFFRIPFHTYYIEEGELPQNVLDLVPENLSMVYWDYYSAKEKRFRHMIHCHKQFKNPMVFAGGAWKWGDLVPYNQFSLGRNDMHLRNCREERVPMVIATAWGDNGAETSEFSVMAVLQQYAEYCYAKGEDREWLKARFQETFHLPFDTFLLLDSPALLSDVSHEDHPQYTAKLLLYNDPLGGWGDFKVTPSYSAEYAQKQEELLAVPENQFSVYFKASAALCGVLKEKATLSWDIREAYLKGEKDVLQQIAGERIPRAIEALEEYHLAAREAWYEERKSFGFDVIELRLGGLKERLRTAQWTLERYLAGEIDSIEQLEQKVLETGHRYIGGWSNIVSGNRV